MTRLWLTAPLMVAILALAGSAFGVQDKDKKDEEDKEVKEAQKAVLDLTKDVTDGKSGKELDAKAAAIKKKYEELNTVMHIYKPKDKGGIGYGKAGQGIELKIIELGRGKKAATAVAKEKDDLIRMANINLAMAAIAKQYAPAKPKGGKGKKDWEQHTEDMRKASEELRKAAKEGKGDLAKKAVTDLNNSCNNCHTDFRDS